MARMRVETAKISTLISKDLHDRLTAMCDVSGMTLSAAVQVCLSVGCGSLEPSIMGSVQRNVSNNEEMLSYFKSDAFMKRLIDMATEEEEEEEKE